MPSHVLEFVQFTITQYLWPVVAVVITFAIAVLLHEFGHFVLARLSGVQVDVFSIGFGKRLWGVQRGGTEYRICAIPVGGYVKMRGILSKEAEQFIEGGEKPSEEQKAAEGAAGDAKAAETAAPAKIPPPIPAGASLDLAQEAISDGVALRDKPWIIRVLVFAAGVGFNFLVAAACYSTIAWVGTTEDAPMPAVFGPIKEWSSVFRCGLRYGDRIVRFDGKSVSTWGRISRSQPPGVFDLTERLLQTKESTRPITCEIVRREEGRETTHSLVLPGAAVLADDWMRGFQPRIAPACLSVVVPFSRAAKGGLQDGDVILAIDDHVINSYDEMQKITESALGRKLVFKVRRGNDELTAVVTPDADPTSPTVGRIGVLPGSANRQTLKLAFVESWRFGFQKATAMTVAIAVGTASVFRQLNYRVMEKNMAGPLGIFGITFQRARQGWTSFLENLAFLNIALLIMNILPIPLLDGGHILITTIEAITRRPVPVRVLASLYYVFIGLLLLLFVMVTWFDVVRFADWFNLGRLLK